MSRPLFRPKHTRGADLCEALMCPVPRSLPEGVGGAFLSAKMRTIGTLTQRADWRQRAAAPVRRGETVERPKQAEKPDHPAVYDGLFVYGTLTGRQRLKKILNRQCGAVRAHLRDTNDGGDYSRTLFARANRWYGPCTFKSDD